MRSKNGTQKRICIGLPWFNQQKCWIHLIFLMFFFMDLSTDILPTPIWVLKKISRGTTFAFALLPFSAWTRLSVTSVTIIIFNWNTTAMTASIAVVATVVPIAGLRKSLAEPLLSYLAIIRFNWLVSKIPRLPPRNRLDISTKGMHRI